MDHLIAATGIGGGATAILHILGYLLTSWKENRQMYATLHGRIVKANIDALQKVIEAETTHPYVMVVRSLGRFLLLCVALFVLVNLTLYGIDNPDAVIHVPDDTPYKLSVFGISLIELEIGTKWEAFTGAVALPIWFMIIGAGITHYFLGDILKR